MQIVVTRPEQNITRVTFFSEEGEVQATLVATRPCAELFDINVVEGKAIGRALFFQKDELSDLSFTAHDNLSLVLRWVRQCNQHLRLPL
jgi:flagellar biosynthesis protein FlhB